MGAGLGEYLCRALSHTAVHRGTEGLGLASGLLRQGRTGPGRSLPATAPSLHAVRSALEEALGVRFEGEKGSCLLPLHTGSDPLLWRLLRLGSVGAPDAASYRALRLAHLRLAPEGTRPASPVPAVVRPRTHFKPLGLVELLDWTAAALDRVDRAAFFDRFDAGEAVPYFYEPFLEAFDPELRKQLGVWYTPAEVVRYMVARVDMALKEDLGHRRRVGS